jgi:hypothetical protein
MSAISRNIATPFSHAMVSIGRAALNQRWCGFIPRGCSLCCAIIIVARIYRSRHDDTLRVTLWGRLSAADMGRLEHICAPALLAHHVALEIDMHGVTSIDRSAAAILDRMAERGARIVPELPMAPG